MPRDRFKVVRRSFLAVVALLACLIVIDYHHKLWPPARWGASSRVSWANFRRIGRGMSLDEVKKILGGYPDKTPPDIPPQGPPKGSTHVEYWSHETDSIPVWFDANERVLAASFCYETTIPHRAESWLFEITQRIF